MFLMNAAQLQSYYDQTPTARRMALVSIGLVMIICSLGLSAVNIAVPRIADDLQVGSDVMGQRGVFTAHGTPC